MPDEVIPSIEAHAPYEDRKPPLLARIIAFGDRPYWRGWRKTSIRAPYGEVSFGVLMLALALGNFGRPHLHVAIPGVQVFFRLPRWKWLVRATSGSDAMGRSFGFSWRFEQGSAIHLQWGGRTKIVNMPWGWCRGKDDYRREYMGSDGQWYDYRVFPHDFAKGKGADLGPDPVEISEPYPYLTDGGVFQDDITATARMERTHMAYRFFGIVLRRKVEHSIHVDFDKEVGSERGSWKGGTVGCGYSMKAGETIRAALLRMRRERRFCR